jgi:uncharacterized membrane protein YheB (UPF0754 family)
MKTYLIYFIPAISGLIGWLTNYIAVKMIFRPRKQINLFGIKIHGLLPRRQEDLAEKIGEVVEEHLVSIEDIHKTVNEPDFHKRLISRINDKINEFLTQKLAQVNPMISAFLTGELLEKINLKLTEQMTEILPELIEEFIIHFENRLNFKELVKNKIKNFDIIKLENIIISISSKELKAIEIFGGILGFLIGIIQVLLIKFGIN